MAASVAAAPVVETMRFVPVAFLQNVSQSTIK